MVLCSQTSFNRVSCSWVGLIPNQDSAADFPPPCLPRRGALFSRSPLLNRSPLIPGKEGCVFSCNHILSQVTDCLPSAFVQCHYFVLSTSQNPALSSAILSKGTRSYSCVPSDPKGSESLFKEDSSSEGMTQSCSGKPVFVSSKGKQKQTNKQTKHHWVCNSLMHFLYHTNCSVVVAH